jgi:hypothetical protein
MKSLLFFFFLLVVAAFFVAAATASPVYEKSGESVLRYVTYDNATFAFTLFDTKPAITGFAARTTVVAAFANVSFTRNITGWDVVEVVAAPELLKLNATAAYYAAGLAEAYVTWESILSNNYSSQGQLSTPTYDWIAENIDFMESYGATGTTTTAHAVKRFLGMLKGLTDGINRAIADAGSSAVRWTLHNAVSLCAQAELGDIETAAAIQYNNRTKTSSTTAAAPTSTALTSSSPSSTTTEAAPTTSAAPETTTATSTTLTEAPTSTTANESDSNPPALQVFTVDETISAFRTAKDLSSPDDSTEEVPVSHGQFPGDPVRGGKFASHCSALVVRTADDLIFSHDTWSSFSTMLRQLKTYRLETDVVFSSYPGSISSIDDWLVSGHGLGVQETTNDCDNDALIGEFVVPQTILTFVRSMAATVWASTTQEWSDIFLTKESSTYNNQWMIIDMKLVTDDILRNKKPLPAGTFRVLEQMPGLANCVSEDQTAVLNGKGFWKSFNLAYYQSVRDINGDQAKCNTEGNFFCYDSYSRSTIYERNASKVVDLDSAEALQQYNGAPYDPLSLVNTATLPGRPCVGCDPAYSYQLAIAARYDLVPVTVNTGNLTSPIAHYTMHHSPFGAIDTKMSSYKLMKRDPATGKTQLTYRARSGPPTSSGQLPVFDWNTYQVSANESKFYLRHRGQPTRFDFNFVVESSVLENSAISPWPNNDSGDQPKSDGLGGGAVAAIVICVVVVVAALIFLAHRKRQSSDGTGRKFEVRGSELESARGGYQQI